MQYPMNVELSGRICAVVGGGHVALRKVRSLLAAGGRVRLIAPLAVDELRSLAAAGKICWHQEPYRAALLTGCFLVICATDQAAVNEQAAADAKRGHILVNAPAEPHLSDFSVPASVRRGHLLLTASTGNLSPAFSRLLRQHLEKDFPESFGPWLDILARLRAERKEQLATSREREAFWRAAMSERVLGLVKNGQLGQAEDEIKDAVNIFGAEPQDGPGGNS